MELKPERVFIFAGNYYTYIMRNLKITFLSFLTLFSLGLTFAPVPVYADEGGSTPPTCVEGPNTGVLVKKTFSSGGYRCYLYALLSQNMPLVILVAVVLVVYSGVEYMSAMGNATQQGKAKTRILAILGGVVFYFLIEYITRLLANNLTLTL